MLRDGEGAARMELAEPVDGVRTQLVDYCGALGHVSPTDMGIKVARAVLEKSGVPQGASTLAV